VPLAGEVIVTQLNVSLAVHAQPGGAVTPAVNVPPALAAGCDAGDTPYVHEGAPSQLNVFDGELRPMPPGPTAATVAVYVIPGVGSELRTDTSARLITPPVPGEGFPRGTV
jgi:hypothetical protein